MVGNPSTIHLGHESFDFAQEHEYIECLEAEWLRAVRVSNGPGDDEITVGLGVGPR